MTEAITFRIYDSIHDVPADWNILAEENIFLSTDYLGVLDVSAPLNMTCKYLAFFNDNILCGIAISQFLDLNQLQSFGDRDKRVKSAIRNFIFKNFNSHVLFIGNNMLTGQNAFVFSEAITNSQVITALQQAILELKRIYKSQGKLVHITTYKDFEEDEVAPFNFVLSEYYKFSIHPNMVFEVRPSWRSFNDYVNSLSKKYRDQYKRSVRKSAGIIRRKMKLEEIIENEEIIYGLYSHVARNAPFNTFFLSKNHFAALKSALGDNFKFYGYFEDDRLIGFNTLIKNGNALDTYFLGYDSDLQRDRLLYLTMLYDMIGYAIKKEFHTIVFARTALEIKSSVGAKPVIMYGFLQHKNSLLQRNMNFFFNYFEPKLEWKPRNPFK